MDSKRAEIGLFYKFLYLIVIVILIDIDKANQKLRIEPKPRITIVSTAASSSSSFGPLAMISDHLPAYFRWAGDVALENLLGEGVRSHVTELDGVERAAKVLETHPEFTFIGDCELEGGLDRRRDLRPIARVVRPCSFPLDPSPWVAKSKQTNLTVFHGQLRFLANRIRVTLKCYSFHYYLITLFFPKPLNFLNLFYLVKFTWKAKFYLFQQKFDYVA